jgi:hypothetical protein
MAYRVCACGWAGAEPANGRKDSSWWWTRQVIREAVRYVEKAQPAPTTLLQQRLACDHACRGWDTMMKSAPDSRMLLCRLDTDDPQVTFVG